MRRFTVFTVLSAIVVFVVGADVFVNDVLPKYKKPSDAPSTESVFDLPDSLPTTDVSDFGSANIFGADVASEGIPRVSNPDIAGFTNPQDDFSQYENVDYLVGDGSPVGTLIPIASPISPTPSSNGSVSSGDFEDSNFVAFSPSVLIREDQIRSAGFSSAYLEEEAHDGFLFKSVYVDDLYDVSVSKYSVKSSDKPLAKVYVFQIGPLSSLKEVYEVLKVRSTEGLDMEVNETNTFGAGSFFINDVRRQNVAFLTVKIGSHIYGFSYPKEYHAQIKNLVKLLEMEFQ